MPVRIQRRRTKGWRMPEGAVYVGRPTVFGNPFRPALRHGQWIVLDNNDVDYQPWANTRLSALRKSVELYHMDLVDLHRIDDQPGLREAIAGLRGHDLACWCPLVDGIGNPFPCHADVLLSIAAGEA